MGTLTEDAEAHMRHSLTVTRLLYDATQALRNIELLSDLTMTGGVHFEMEHRLALAELSEKVIRLTTMAMRDK